VERPQTTDVTDQEAAALLELYSALPAEIRPLVLDTLRRYEDRDSIAGPFGWQVGYHYTSRTPGQAVCELDVTPAHFNPANIAHGGVIYTMVDAAMGSAVFTALRPGQRCVTAEIKINYLLPVTTGRVVATAKVVKMGSRIAVVTAEVTNAADELVGIALGSFAVLNVG
jgi:acyl-CoA thioesterase